MNGRLGMDVPRPECRGALFDKRTGAGPDLRLLVTNWELYLGDQGLPIFFSEDNFISTPTHQGTKSDAMNEAAYMADL